MTCKIDHDAENAIPSFLRAAWQSRNEHDQRELSNTDMGDAVLVAAERVRGVRTGSLRSIVALLFAFGAFAEEL